jgi:ribosomal RNA-processing protein 9
MVDGVARKRARDSPSATAPNGPATAYERKRQAMDADEIDSDEGGRSDEEDGAAATGEAGDDEEGAGSEEDEVDANETVEEKRLRLARAYLAKVGLDPDATGLSGSDDSESDSDDGGGGVGGRDRRAIENLQAAARRDAGRAVDGVAAYIGERYPCRGEGPKTVPVTRSVRAHDIAPTCVTMASDEGRAASGGKDSRVIVWDVETGTALASLRPKSYLPSYRKNPSSAPGHVGHVHAVAIADDQGCNIVASGGADGLVRIWDVRAAKQVDALRGHRGPVNALAFRAGTMQLFTASTDRTVKIWDINDMAYVETLFGHGAEVCGIDSFTKERAISCGRDGTMRLYKVLDGSQLVFRRAFTTSLDAVAMVNEQRFVSGDDDGAVSLWHVAKKRPVSVAERAHGSGTGCDAWISSVAAARNTDLVASGAGDGIVRLWQCDDRPPAISQVAAVDVGPGFANGLALGASGRLLVAAVGQEHRLGRWERKRGVKSGLRFVVLPHKQ